MSEPVGAAGKDGGVPAGLCEAQRHPVWHWKDSVFSVSFCHVEVSWEAGHGRSAMLEPLSMLPFEDPAFRLAHGHKVTWRVLMSRLQTPKADTSVGSCDVACSMYHPQILHSGAAGSDSDVSSITKSSRSGFLWLTR